MNKKLKTENQKLQNRVRELEEILCPCEQHDLIETGCTNTITDEIHITGYDTTRYICKNCKKIVFKNRWS